MNQAFRISFIMQSAKTTMFLFYGKFEPKTICPASNTKGHIQWFLRHWNVKSDIFAACSIYFQTVFAIEKDFHFSLALSFVLFMIMSGKLQAFLQNENFSLRQHSDWTEIWILAVFIYLYAWYYFYICINFRIYSFWHGRCW